MISYRFITRNANKIFYINLILFKDMLVGKSKTMIIRIFAFILLINFTIIGFNIKMASALEIDSSGFIKKVSKSYTKKFCNSIAFGLSQESAMNFSIEENKQVFKKRKEMQIIDKELLAEEIATSVVVQCGYPINLSGEEGIKEFKNYYLAKDNDSSEKGKTE